MGRAEPCSVPLSPAPAASDISRPSPASLPPAALARRLVELCGEERALQVEFLIHLMEFDDRRAYAGAGYPSLWAYCTEVLHLREGATWRRIEAMKLLRRFPSLEGPLREGRLCLTTVNLLGPVLTEENVDELVGRAAFLSKVETQRLVAAVSEGDAANDAGGDGSASSGPQTLPLLASVPVPHEPAASLSASGPRSVVLAAPCAAAAAVTDASAPAAPVARAFAASVPARKAELRPVGKDTWSLRVTLDDAARAELLALAALTAHSTRGDLAAVLRDAVRAALARQRKRRGAARSERKKKDGGRAVSIPGNTLAAAAKASASNPAPAPAKTAAPPTPSTSFATTSPAEPDHIAPANEPGACTATMPSAFDPRAIPMAVREAVWERDGGRCAWGSPDGKRCGSTWKLELGHVRPVALGGQATVDGLRLECATHNQLEAVRVFGRRHMARFQPGLDFRRRK